MKAIDLLTWLIKECVNTEGMDIIQVDKDFDYETFFGYQPDGDFPVGEYAYLYSDDVTDVDMQRLGELTDDQVYTITTDMEDKKNGGNCVIYLFKLED